MNTASVSLTSLSSSGPSPPAAATAKLTEPPSYKDVETFLIALVQWTQHACDRLTCAEQTEKLSDALESLAAFNAKLHPTPSALKNRTATQAQEGRWPADAHSAASLSMTLSTARSLFVLCVLWGIIVYLLSGTLPGLRLRHRTSQMRAWLQRTEETIQFDVLLRRATGVLRRRTRRHQLLAAALCTCVATALIVVLLTVHVWTGLVLAKMWETAVAPVVQAWSWAATLRPPGASPPSAVRMFSAAVSDVLQASRVPHVLQGVPNVVWQLTRQVQAMYLWHLAGSAVLGLALGLLRFAHQRMQMANAALPSVTSRSTEPQLLVQLRESEARHRARHALRLQMATLRHTQAIVDRVKEAEAVRDIGALLRDTEGRGTVSLLEAGEAAASEPTPTDAAAAAAATDGIGTAGDPLGNPLKGSDGDGSAAQQRTKVQDSNAGVSSCVPQEVRRKGDVDAAGSEERGEDCAAGI